LRILQQHSDKSKDLEDKCIFLASRLLLLCGVADSMGNAQKLAIAQLKN
jgi:thymidine phosphorylase